MAIVTPVVKHWMEREIAQWSTMKDRSEDPSHQKECSYHGARSLGYDFTLKINNHRAITC